MYSEVEKIFDKAVTEHCRNLQGGSEIARHIIRGDNTPKKQCIENLCREVMRYEKRARAARYLVTRDTLIKSVVEMHVKAVLDLTATKMESDIAKRKRAEKQNAIHDMKQVLKEYDPDSGEVTDIDYRS